MRPSDELPAKRRQRPIMDRLRRYVRNRSERERSLYVGMRAIVEHRTARVRRGLGRELAAEAAGVINRSDGFLVIPPGTFEEVGAVVAAARAMIDGMTADELERRARGKDFMVPCLDPKTLRLHSPYLAFALCRDVVATVSAYLGLIPILASVEVYYSRTMPVASYRSSQLYHCDNDDRSQVKLFVLCTEVKHDNGPLTILDAQTSARLRRATGYLFGSRVEDDVAARVSGGASPFALVGPAGTTCLLDTSRCFHYGSRVQRGAEPRVMAVFQYVSPFSFLPTSDKGQPFRRLSAPGLPTVTRLVLGERDPT